jgi:hypothetical protein
MYSVEKICQLRETDADLDRLLRQLEHHFA